MKTTIGFDIKLADSGYVLEVWKYYLWGIFARRIRTIAFTQLDELISYIKENTSYFLDGVLS